MTVRLSTPSGGSVSIKAQDTTQDYTLTAPALGSSLAVADSSEL